MQAIYHFDALTGIYLCESKADESPLEPGVYLIPAHATDVPPPDEIAAGSAAFWRAGAWAVEVVPFLDTDLDGQQDAPEGFAPEPNKPGFFARIKKLVGL